MRGPTGYTDFPTEAAAASAPPRPMRVAALGRSVSQYRPAGFAQ